MQKRVLVLVVFAALLQLSLALIESRDVCIIGGGIGGMSTAVFLKDRGYTTIVLEESDTTGGACDTVRFTPPAGETVDWIDVGVQEFPNTTDANIKGRGPWTVDSVAFFARFGGGLSNVIPFGRSGRISYNVDMKRGIQQPVVPFVPDAAWAAAMGRFKAVLARYPWVDSAQVPSVVPPELLVSFDSFVETNQLEPLLPNIFNWFLWSGGLQYYSELTALYAVLNLGPTILGLTSDSVPFTLKGGCRSLYDGIEAFLGERNVLVNAKIKSVKRVTGQPHIITGTVTDPSKRSYQSFQYSCGQVFIAFAPTYDKVDALFDLDNNERNYYTKVKMRPYFAVAVDMKGPIIDGQLFSIRNVDLNRDNDLPALPALQFLGRQENFGPVQGGATGRREISVDNMREIIQDQLDNIPSNLVTNATVVGLWRHEFQPYYTSNSLSAIPSPPAVLRSLQGYRNTWVVGSVDSFPSHVQIIERTYHLITDNFPVKV